MNEYLKNLNKTEFAVTTACTGRCKHCQNGEPVSRAEQIDAGIASAAVRKICAHYRITTLLTFGGEPLLYPEAVYRIQKTAAELGIGRRQVITNGYFSEKKETIEAVARALAESGVNDLLVSADAFHQETVPLEPVLCFAGCAVKNGVPVRMSPAWLVSRADENPYNLRTREILRAFERLQIPVGEGNVVFPGGNALKYLRGYFGENVTESSPYDEDPEDVRCLSFSANGDVLNGNIYKTDILEILRTYRP